MKTVVLVFTCDPWHTAASKEMIGVATTRPYAYKIIKDFIKKHNYDPISEDDWVNIDRINQTQNYKEAFEFLLEEVEPNTVL